MIVSPFTPLFFIDRRADGIDSEYLQVFATTDHILLEIISAASEEAPKAWINYEGSGGKIFQNITFDKWNMNGSVSLFWCELTLPEGCYNIEIEGYGVSQPFEVTDDEYILDETTLIQYTMKDNRQRTDAVFVIDGERKFFDFRVHGGFKDVNWTFTANSEQFSDENADIVQLWGMESTQKKFTLGGSDGVPIWFGEFLNRILVCSYVYFDGEQYVRKENSSPEPSQTLEGHNSFTFLVMLQKAFKQITTEIENQIYLRRVDGKEDYRTVEGTIPRAIVK